MIAACLTPCPNRLHIKVEPLKAQVMAGGSYPLTPRRQVGMAAGASDLTPCPLCKLESLKAQVMARDLAL
jgi:hypothetical protein